MPRILLTDLHDPRIAVFRDLNQQNLTRYSGLFIAEGDKVVERLLESDYGVESLLVEERFLPRFESLLPADTPLYTGPQVLLEQIIGFNFHRGVLACGRRKPPSTLKELAAKVPPRSLVVACPDVQDPTNLGSIIRTSASFGASAVLLGDQCADPFSRRVLRVSMGAVFGLPIIECADLAADLTLLKHELSFDLIATVVDAGAENLATSRRPHRLALLLGGEGHGLASEWLDLSTRRVTIPMQLGVDSLNVAVAAAIFLFHFQESQDVSRNSTVLPPRSGGLV